MSLRHIACLPLLIASAGCVIQYPKAAASTSGAELAGHSIDLSAIDRSIRPGTDFFMYANGAWLGNAEIPADRPATGAWLRVLEQVELRTKGLLEEAAHANAPAGSNLRKIGDYYATYLDESAIEARGVAPLAPTLERIANIADARGLAAELGSQIRADVDALNNTTFHTANVLGLWVEQDLNEPTRHAPYLMQGGLGMPDRSYYLDNTPKMIGLREKYERHIATILRLSGVADPEAKAGRVVSLERQIATGHASRADSSDVTKGNNPWPRQDFATRAPGLDWDAFFAAAGLDHQTSIIVWHPTAVAGLATLVKDVPMETWKEYLTARAIDRASPFLPHAFADESFAFYSKELRGIAAPPPRWRRAIDATNDALGEAVGEAYVTRFFPPEAKQTIERIAANLVTGFGRRIDALDWMSAATKTKAKEKLATLRVDVGYPKMWRDISALPVVAGDALGNFERASLFEYRRNIAKLARPMDRNEWVMLPQVVNAVNLPIRNMLIFPAAILVPPFFDPKATAAANYGAIGSVIGHEISHSFDDQGAKFDARGRLIDWWTPDDFAHFQASGAALASQFSAYRPLPDLSVDGKLTLGENIADLAGLAVAHDAWLSSLGGGAAPTQDGLTGEQQFFLAYAQTWQSKEREQQLRKRLATDGHAPPRYRVLTVRNIDAWYGAFDVQPQDELFLAPSKRVRVW